MKKAIKVLVALLLVFSLSFIVSCGKDNDTHDVKPGDLPIVDWPS